MDWDVVDWHLSSEETHCPTSLCPQVELDLRTPGYTAAYAGTTCPVAAVVVSQARDVPVIVRSCAPSAAMKRTGKHYGNLPDQLVGGRPILEHKGPSAFDEFPRTVA